MLETDATPAKRAVGLAAAALVADGDRVGLGTGSTAYWFIEALAERVALGLRVSAVPTSEASAAHAMRHSIPLGVLSAAGLDIAVDGADWVDPDLRLIKGGGGSHVRERIVAAAARRFVVIVDARKVVAQLSGAIPLEILDFGIDSTLAAVGDICAAPARVRVRDGAPVRSDSGNMIADVTLASIPDPEGLAAELDAVPGMVGHGLFLGMTDLLMVGDGATVREIHPSR